MYIYMIYIYITVVLYTIITVLLHTVLLNSTTIHNNRNEGKFINAKAINLCSRHLSRDEISLFSEGLKFVPTPKYIKKAKIKEEIEAYGRKLRLMGHFGNDHREFHINPFKKKSKFNPKGDAAIEMYLSRLEEEILYLDENYLTPI